jgi:hypothetical protein
MRVAGPPGALTTAEKEELARLRREIKQLTAARIQRVHRPRATKLSFLGPIPCAFCCASGYWNGKRAPQKRGCRNDLSISRHARDLAAPQLLARSARLRRRSCHHSAKRS